MSNLLLRGDKAVNVEQVLHDWQSKYLQSDESPLIDKIGYAGIDDVEEAYDELLKMLGVCVCCVNNLDLPEHYHNEVCDPDYKEPLTLEQLTQHHE